MKRSGIDMKKRIIHLPPKKKRHNQIAFIDSEMEQVLNKYLKWWEKHNFTGRDWLWITGTGARLHKDDPGKIIATIAEPLGLHNSSKNAPLSEKLTPHCFRHFMTTILYQAGMDPQYIMWLRGDALNNQAWQIYHHIDLEKIRTEYERCIPSLL